MCFRYWFPFLMLLFHAFNHCNFASLQIYFLTKLMMIAFVLSIIDSSWAALLINWSAFSFSIMFLRLDIHCMWIWHWFWRKLIKFCRMSSNNFALTLLFAFSLCKVIWLFNTCNTLCWINSCYNMMKHVSSSLMKSQV